MKQKKPSGLLLVLFKLPLWIYKFKLGWLLGHRFLRLAHIGRTSGKAYQSVIEIIYHDKVTPTYYVVSAYGQKADWYKNITNNPSIKISTGRKHDLPATFKQLSVEEGAERIQAYARRHPILFKELLAVVGLKTNGTSEEIQELSYQLPVIAFTPKSS